SVPSSPRLFGQQGSYTGVIRYRNADDKGAAALPGIVPAQNLAAVRAHDTVANAQAQSSAFAGLLGSVKGIEDVLRIRDARAVIADRHFYGSPVQPCANNDAAALTRFL